MDINHIVTPLDADVLSSRAQYSLYFTIVDHGLKELVANTETTLFPEQEFVFFKQYCELFRYSLEAMRIKYLYDEEEVMRIDRTESGFPNYLEFRYLYNDLLLSEQHLEKLPKIETLKAEMLQQLLKDKAHIPEAKLKEAAAILYYTKIDKEYIFKRFVQGKIVETTAHNASYVVSWCFYDITYNRPFICFMYFQYSGENIEKDTQDIYKVLAVAADRYMNIDAMAYGIDKKLTTVHPTHIRRVDLGPLYSIFAKDENVITHTLIESITKKEIELSSFAMLLGIDQVSSTGNFEEKGFFSRQQLQVWKVDTQQQHVFTSHRTLQLLHDKIPEFIHNLTGEQIEIREIE